MSSDGSNYSPGWFDSGRPWPFPSQYGENKTPVTVDVLQVGIMVAFGAVFVSLACFLPILKDLKLILWFTRCTLTLLIGLAIMMCNFGQEWEVGMVNSTMPYRAGTAQEVNAKIGVWMGLRGLNITLKNTTQLEGDLSGETINYNERFFWTWQQGRPGFGPFAGEIQQQYRAAQHRGAPIPILWIAEYFTIDGEGLRWGRHYRHAGWYAHLCLWAALPSWILSVILFKMVIIYGAFWLSLTGSFLVSAALIWAIYRNPFELNIPFEHGHLVTKFGFHWYLAIILGSVCIVLGFVIYILDTFFPKKCHNQLSQFFKIDPINILEVDHTDGNFSASIRTPRPTNEHEMEVFGQQHSSMSRKVSIKGRGTSNRNRRNFGVSGSPITTIQEEGRDNSAYISENQLSSVNEEEQEEPQSVVAEEEAKSDQVDHSSGQEDSDNGIVQATEGLNRTFIVEFETQSKADDIDNTQTSEELEEGLTLEDEAQSGEDDKEEVQVSEALDKRFIVESEPHYDLETDYDFVSIEAQDVVGSEATAEPDPETVNEVTHDEATPVYGAPSTLY